MLLKSDGTGLANVEEKVAARSMAVNEKRMAMVRLVVVRYVSAGIAGSIGVAC